MDSKRYGRKKFIKKYQTAGDIVVNKGYDFHDDNPYEKAAEKWGIKTAGQYIREYK